MEEPVRLRLVFEDRHVLSKPQRSEGLKRSWLLVRPGLRTVSDVASYIADAFDLRSSCPNGLLLSMDGFVLPAFESTSIFKDKDVIMVKKKDYKPREVTRNCYDANLIENVRIVERLPLLLCDKLAVDNSDGEAGDQAEEPNDFKYTLPKSVSPKRKRKHSDTRTLQSSKRKKTKISSPQKLRSTPTEDNEVVQIEQIKSCHQKDNICEKTTTKRNGRSPIADGIAASTSDTNGTPEDKVVSAHVEDRHDLTPEKSEGTESNLNADAGTKKIPSRSARRKKAKRLWLRKHANSESKELAKNHLPQNISLQKLEECQVHVQNHLPESSNHQKPPECQKVVQNIGSDEKIVPIVVSPGHIRFEPLDEEPSIQHKPDHAVTFQWNGTTSKKKGQKWGREKIFTTRMDNKSSTREQSDRKHNVGEAEATRGSLDLKKLVPLTRSPKEGEVVAYQLVELSSSWCPEISSVRIGQVTSFDPETLKAVLVPVPGYPISTETSDEESELQTSPLYKEDGSLEIDFTSLIDVRVFLNENPNDATLSAAKKELSQERDSAKQNLCLNNTAIPAIAEAAAPSSATKESGGWDEVDRALKEKKAELLRKDGLSNWSTANEQHSSNNPWTFRALRRSALGPTISLLRASKAL